MCRALRGWLHRTRDLERGGELLLELGEVPDLAAAAGGALRPLSPAPAHANHSEAKLGFNTKRSMV
jgi:hypothetical protein